MRISGTLYEINSKMSRILFAIPKMPGLSSPGHSTQRRAPLPISHTSRKQSPQHAFFKNFTDSFTTAGTTDMDIAIHFRLVTLDPFLVTQTNSFPRSRSLQMTLVYDQIEEEQWRLPEIADVRFYIKDIVPLGLTQDEVHLQKYFHIKHQDLNYVEEYQHAHTYLRVLRCLRKRRRMLRAVFLSYNVESMQTLPDLLTMNFNTFVSFVKDAMLLTKDFDLLDAAKVFYLSYISSKTLPESAVADEKSWLRALVMGSAFKENYHLQFPNFLEALVRMVALHPRFVRLTSVPIDERLNLLYKRDLKPNVRTTQALFYIPYLSDPFIMRAIYLHESELHLMFDGYQTRLSDVEKVTDFHERHGKIELPKFYALLSNSGILLDADIERRQQEDVDDELMKLHGGDPRKAMLHNRLPGKASTIRFPSTLFEKAENKNIKIVASKNVRNSGPQSSLSLPFYRPLRGKFLIDKLTIFNFFVTVMKVTPTQTNDELFLSDPHAITDHKFVITFSEFCEVIGLIGIHFWKTTSNCEDLSMAEGVSYFVKIMIERHRFYRELKGMTSSKLMAESKEVLIAYTKSALNSELPVITKTALAQERFVQRRFSS